jgi:hypothetical protein
MSAVKSDISRRGELENAVFTLLHATPLLANQLHGAEFFVRSHQSLSYARISQCFMVSKGSLPCSQEPNTGNYPEPDESIPYQPILLL